MQAHAIKGMNVSREPVEIEASMRSKPIHKAHALKILNLVANPMDIEATVPSKPIRKLRVSKTVTAIDSNTTLAPKLVMRDKEDRKYQCRHR